MVYQILVYQPTTFSKLWYITLYPTCKNCCSFKSMVRVPFPIVYFILDGYLFEANRIAPTYNPIKVISSLFIMNFILNALRSQTIGPSVLSHWTLNTMWQPCRCNTKNSVIGLNPWTPLSPSYKSRVLTFSPFATLSWGLELFETQFNLLTTLWFMKLWVDRKSVV